MRFLVDNALSPLVSEAMNKETAALQRRLHILAFLILLLGFGSAAAIYATAAPAQSTAAYDLANSKKYVHDLELYGGKMNVLSDRFLRRFEELWHGRQLAFTTAAITLFVSLGLALAAHRLPRLTAPEDGKERRT